ncbi:MAG TPA: hypothetical protein VFG48_11780 [Xanthomonadales bacterium]|nr:hypothetical protein [Xanthomonadales bacterium]
MSEPGASGALVAVQADVLHHAAEFVELVYRQAPGEYRRLLEAGRFVAELQGGGVFNHGKLYAYAEFSVFRREFALRFPDASPAACINAFSKLFLKNDISMHNLVEFVEGADDRAQLRLNSPP